VLRYVKTIGLCIVYCCLVLVLSGVCLGLDIGVFGLWSVFGKMKTKTKTKTIFQDQDKTKTNINNETNAKKKEEEDKGVQ
jgi:hypothetical protein